MTLAGVGLGGVGDTVAAQESDIVSFDVDGNGVIGTEEMQLGLERYQSGDDLAGQPVTFDDVRHNFGALVAEAVPPIPSRDGVALAADSTAPESVDPGEEFAVTYEIAHIGSELGYGAGLDVSPRSELELNGIDAQGVVVEERGSVFYPQFPPGETTAVTLVFTVESDAEPGDVTLEGTAAIGNKHVNVGRSITITDPDSGTGGGSDGGEDDGDDGSTDLPQGSVAVSIEPVSDRPVPLDSTADYEVVVSGADNGIASYGIDVAIGNPETVRIEDVTPAGTTRDDTLTSVEIGADGATASVAAGTADPSGSTIATVTLAGVTEGTDELVVDGEPPIGDVDGNSYTIESVSGAPLTVAPISAPAVVGDTPAQDTDGDGRFEDVNGDGELDIVDVNAFFQNRNSQAVQNNSAGFDFNGDGEVNIVDVNRLFNSATQ